MIVVARSSLDKNCMKLEQGQDSVILCLKAFFVLCVLSWGLLNNSVLAINPLISTPEYPQEQNDQFLDQYLNSHLSSAICSQYSLKDPINIKQAVNITIACNRNIHKLLISRIVENYNLSVADYKFKPNMRLNLGANYQKYDNSADSSLRRFANITPSFNILTPIGTTIDLNWENYVSKPSGIDRFKNASTITIKQPLLKNSGYDLQTASVENANDSNKLQLFRLFDTLENEVNKTIFLFRQIIQNKNQLDIQEKVLAISKKLYDQTKMLIKAGRLAQYELTQVESQVASQEVNLADARISLRKSYLNLSNHLGINKNIEITYPEQFTNLAEPLKTSPEQLFELVKVNHVAYQNIITEQKIVQRDYYNAYNQSRWNLDLTARYNIQGYDNSYPGSVSNHFSSSDQNSSFGIQFDIPIDNNPNRNQALVANKIRLRQIELDKMQIEQEIFAELQDVLYQNKILWDKLQLAKRSVKIKQDNFNMAKKKFEAGRLSSFELVRIQDDVESAKVLENNNTIAYMNNITILDKLLNKTLPLWGVNISIT